MSDTVRPHRWKPTRLPCPWDSPGKNTGVGCHCLLLMGSYLSITTLNVNGLNAPTKRQRLAEWMQKQDPYICCLQDTHLKPRDTYKLKVKGWKKIFYANRDQKKAEVAILISDKIDFERKAVKRDKEGHYIMIKGSVQEEDTTTINIYAPNIGATQYEDKC